ncbi:MAG: prenyltransferase [Euryarchaeota archaeon]|nr:prenyltransferase [Euryarchaeota archaeon]
MNYNKNTLVKIVKLGRPQFLCGGFLLFSIGALLAVLFNAEFVLGKFIVGYIILSLAHLALHYSNDYFDIAADRYLKPTAISGGSGVLVRNPQLREFSKWFAVALIFSSITLAAVFTVIFSYPVWFFLFVVFGNFLVWFYSAPPIKLSYRGFAEISNIFNGILLPAMGYFTLMGTLNAPFLIFTIPIVFLQLIFTIGVEIPDMEGDKLGGKITWIVSRGREFGFKLITISGLLAAISFLIISITKFYPAILDFRILAFFALIPLSLGIIGLLRNPVDKESATKLATIDVSSVFVVAILINCYFTYLITTYNG